MANDIVMPRLGWTMESGRLVEWFKQDGEAVEAGELLFAVETDKAIQEVESLDTGVLHIPSDSPIGEDAPVGALLGYILAPGEVAPAGSESSAPASTATSVAGSADSIVRVTEPVAVVAQEGSPAISPRAKRVAAELGVDWVVVAGSGSTGRIIERDIRAAAELLPGTAEIGGRSRATPSVKRLAEEHGIDLAVVAGSAPGGRVTRNDVASAARNGRGDSFLPAASHLVVEPDDTVTPMSAARRITALRMAEAAHTVAPVTLNTEIDATELVATRARLKADLAAGGGIVPTLTDLLAKLTAQALVHHPRLNSALDGETIVQHAGIHIGIAVDAERGLFAPVIRNADQKSLFAIAEESASLIASARAGSLAPDLMSGSTFTITNLGMFGVDAFTPILNLPEAAILGVGRIVAKPVVVNEDTEEIAVRKMLTLSLTFDHRVVDGAPAARFLQTLSGMIEHPMSWLMR